MRVVADSYAFSVPAWKHKTVVAVADNVFCVDTMVADSPNTSRKMESEGNTNDSTGD